MFLCVTLYKQVDAAKINLNVKTIIAEVMLLELT